jgi:hypothetical protein
MRAMIATILMSANQNSSSPKTFTPIMLIAAMKNTTASTQIHRGTLGNQKPMYTPIAVASKTATRTISKAKVQPTRNPANGWMIVGGVLAEGAGDGVADDEFAEGAHDHEDGGAADDVGQQYGRSCRLDRLRRAHEEAGADGGPEGYEADVASGQAPFQAGVLFMLVG